MARARRSRKPTRPVVDLFGFLEPAWGFFHDVLDAVRDDKLLAILWGFGVVLLIFDLASLRLAQLTPTMQFVAIVLILAVLVFLFVFTLSKIPDEGASGGDPRAN